MTLGYGVAGALVGVLVGMTGVGGGSLMAPLLILLFGFNPSVAVGTDLWFAAVTKSVGGLVHRRVGSPDWQIVGRLAAGSVPAALVTVLWLNLTHHGKLDSTFMMRLIAVALIVTAILAPLKGNLRGPLARMKSGMGRTLRGKQVFATVAGGALVGVLVTLTSIGAGALVAVMLMIFYPMRLGTKSIVGTDIMHAIPLALVAALGHSYLGNVDWSLLAQLLVGSIPGIIVGSLLASRINDKVMTLLLSAMLILTGIKLLAG